MLRMQPLHMDGLQHRYTYTMRNIPNIGDDLKRIDDAIDEFIIVILCGYALKTCRIKDNVKNILWKSWNKKLLMVYVLSKSVKLYKSKQFGNLLCKIVNH